MALFRVLQTTQMAVTHTFTVGDAATDASAGVTATLKRLDGTLVHTAAATHPGADGLYSYTPPAQPAPDLLTLDWAGTIAGAAVVVRDIVEIVGGFLFEIAEARNAHKQFASSSVYPYATLAAKRTGVEQECEFISGQAWVPRFARFLLDGSGTDELVVPDMLLRSVRTAKVADRAGAAFTALSADQLAAVAALPAGILARDDGNVWPQGRRNVIVEYEHGHDAPREDIHDAALLRLRSRIGMFTSGVPDRTLSFTTPDGGVYRLTMTGPRATGIPEVDAAYLRDAQERLWIAS